MEHLVKIKFKSLYCPKCGRDTTHREVENDEFFDHAAECIVCGVVWQMNEGWNEVIATQKPSVWDNIGEMEEDTEEDTEEDK